MNKNNIVKLCTNFINAATESITAEKANIASIAATEIIAAATGSGSVADTAIEKKYRRLI